MTHEALAEILAETATHAIETGDTAPLERALVIWRKATEPEPAEDARGKATAPS
jgi:hypothetical protein